MARFPEHFESERLVLKFSTVDDTEEIFARYAQDPEVTRYLSWKPHRCIDDTREFLQSRVELRAQGTAFGWLIRERSTGRVVGSIGLLAADGHRAELGYCFAQDAWNQGFATEAVKAVVALVERDPAMWRLQAFCELANERSCRVLEKAGFVREGILKRYSIFPNLDEEPRDVHCYAWTRNG